MHARQSIREAVATAVTGLATTGSRVFQSRMRAQESLPCLLVTTNDESVDRVGVENEMERVIEIQITGLAQSASGLDDTVDTIAEEVETAIGANPTFGGKVRGMQLSGIAVDFDDSLQQPVAAVTLRYRATYFTNAGTPGTTL